MKARWDYIPLNAPRRRPMDKALAVAIAFGLLIGVTGGWFVIAMLNDVCR